MDVFVICESCLLTLLCAACKNTKKPAFLLGNKFFAVKPMSCTLRAGKASLIAKSDFTDDFHQNIFPQCCGSGSGFGSGSTCFWASRIRIH